VRLEHDSERGLEAGCFRACGSNEFRYWGTLTLSVFLQTIQGNGPSGAALPVFSFLGFLLMDLGLFMIV
jgi:hypothetical protein